MARTAKLEYENFAASTLDGAILAGDGTLDVQAGDAAAYFPAATDFNVRVGDDTQGYEIVKVTNIAADTFTITRAQEGTGALPFDDNTAVWLVVSKEYIEQLQRPLEIIEDGYQKNLLPEAFLMEWGSNGDNWPGTSFTADSAALDNAQFYCGLLSLKVVADNLELWVCSSGIGAYNIPLIIGQKYVASMYCRENAGAGEVTLRVRQDDGDNHDGGATAVDNLGWTRVYSAFTADSEMCNIQVINTHANNRTYYCDAFQLEMVDSTVTVPSDYSPPPAATTMLRDVDIAGDANIAGDTTLNGDTTCGDDFTADVTRFDSQVAVITGNEPSHLFRAANPKNLVVNGGFETWLAGTTAVPTGWELPGGVNDPTIAREAATVKEDIYSIELTNNGADATQQIVFAVTNWADYIGDSVTLGAWVWCASTLAQIWLGDGVNTTTASHTGSSSWEWLSVTLPSVDGAAAYLNVRLYVTTNATVGYFDGVILAQGEEEWTYPPGDDRLGNINLPLAGWWDLTDTENIDVADTDPALGSQSIYWADADTDQIITTVVIPEDYDADADDCWFVGYYFLGAAEDNVTIDLETFRQRLGAAFDAAATAYDHTAVYHGVNDQNVDRAVYKITETLQAGDVLQLAVVRADDGVDTAALNLLGTNLIYVKR